MKTKAVILLSGGLDSLTALAEAQKKYQVILAITFDYGQRAAKKEQKAARQISRHYKVKHQVIKLGWYKKIIHSALVDTTRKIPEIMTVKQGSKATAESVWVPNRNGLFLNIADGFAIWKNQSTY